MADSEFPGRWVLTLGYLVIAAALTFCRLLPLDSLPTAWAGPDLLICVTMAWMLRRPDSVPMVLIAMVALMGDLLFQRPPGLWAAITVGLSDFLRRREEGLRDAPFPLEWGVVGLAFVMSKLLYRIVQTLFVVPNEPLGLTLTQIVVTIAAYPLVVLALNTLFGLRRAAPGEVDSLGHKR
ncbi:rod shape-determining protein MreD [Donghicola sp. C2-DW-16]|uniref:Rod shape-determining protein MreD n=1 Tax=Donghicola mangrovi TaxID=2729614 RepID=A0A850Q946_9RHOB|nr:rod shape-determining protein MreD [Donghicola mangrovi]NVO22491.1 rod shape-determining protein MreD [Donghicola mangrovi]NVO25917.1 rod shape-determining protein MreD [Donghicola mangrovi]